MSKSLTAQHKKQSALDSFTLSFEYDISWKDVKKQTKERSAE
ncbi:MAG: hypothetical protein WAQ25_00780 [Candidatus Saccharimonas sp.]